MNTLTPKIVVIGSAYVDMAIRCEKMLQPGKEVQGCGFSWTLTGPGPNQAAQAALCGCRAYLISKIGGDPFGRTIKEQLEQLNVNTDYIFTAEARNTGIKVTVVDSEGENASCRCTGANNALRPEDIDSAEQVIADADICLIHGELPHETVEAAIKLAKLHGTKVILNPARPLDNQILPIDCFSDNILIPNLYEAAKITEHSAANFRAAKLIGSELVARGVETAVITMGRRGCMIVDRNGADQVEAFEIELVDQTCTGDAFAGALAACLAAKDSIKNAVKFASAAGALACTKFGSIESLPLKAEIIQLLQKGDFSD